MATLPFSVSAIAPVTVGMGLVGLQLLGSGALAQPVGAPASPGPGQIPNSQRLSAPGPLPASPAAPLSPLAAPGAIPGPAEPVAPIPPLSEDAFQSLLKDDDLERLNLGCARILQEDNTVAIILFPSKSSWCVFLWYLLKKKKHRESLFLKKSELR